MTQAGARAARTSAPAAPAPARDDAALDDGSLDESTLYSLVRRQTCDADEQAACLRDWGQVYEQLAPGRFEGRFVEIAFRGIQLFREVTNRPLYEAGLIRTGERVLGIPVQMSGQGHCCGRPILPDSIVTMRGGGELDFRAPDDFDIVAVAIPEPTLARYARDIEQCDIDAAWRCGSVVYPAKAAIDAFRALLLTMLDTVSRTPAMLQHAAVQRALEQSLLTGVFSALAGDDDTPRAAPQPSVRHALVSRAQDYMRAHVDQPLTVEDLCRTLRVSRRTLQYSFQEVLQLNPVSYLRALRLNGARRTLKRADAAPTSVQEVAARWGFWHLSHFATDYRRMFGELPSQTLRQHAPVEPLRAATMRR